MRNTLLTPLLFGIAALGLWQAIVVLGALPEYLLPAPTAILAAVDWDLFVQLGVTFSEALAGFAIASGLAFGIALVFVRFPTLERGLFPIAIAIKTTPIIAIAPLLVLWQGTGWWSKITA